MPTLGALTGTPQRVVVCLAWTQDLTAAALALPRRGANRGDAAIRTDDRPTTRDGLLTAELRGRHVVFDAERRDLFELREDAAALWPALDGSVSIDVLTRDLQVAAGLSPAAASTLLHGLLEPLVATGLVVLVPADPDGPVP